jgi:hypothetical protein
MNADRHSQAHLKESLSQARQTRINVNNKVNERRAVDERRVKDQQQQLIRMRMDQLITDHEFVVQRSLLATRLAELEKGVSSNEQSLESVLKDLDAVCGQLANLGGAWDGIATDLKKRFQQLALPTGYIFGRIRTAQKGRLFSFLEAFDTPKASLVPLTGLSWNQLAEEIKAFASIFREASSQMVHD